MKVATIVPTPLLDIIDAPYNMCLYHIVKSNPAYAEYFRKAKEAGKFVLMDNGAAEGVNPTIGELMAVYPLVEPTEIILPDVVYDKAETLKRTQEAYLILMEAGLDSKYQFLAVPQGSNFSEWLLCMREMIRQSAITTIGISKFVTPRYEVEMGVGTNVRLECVDAILTEAKLLKRDIQIHLLGCWESPKEVGEIASKYGSAVRGTDSAIAYVYTRAGVEITADNKRPDNAEIDFHEGTVTDTELLKDNIMAWERLCTNM